MKNIFTILFALIIINANSQNPLAIDSIAYVLPSDSNTCDGQIVPYISGGCVPYAIVWKDFQISPVSFCCGVYPFKVYDNCGDSIADTAFLACSTAIINFNISQKITITPNPFQDHFTITISQNQTAQINIYNLYGKSVYQSSIIGQQSTINLFNQPSGIYFLKVCINNQIKLFKIIKI